MSSGFCEIDMRMGDSFDVETALGSPAGYLDPYWYAIYTCANHEKRVHEQLERRSLESFLPSYESMRHWRDRKIKLQLPLFPGYVFVHLALVDRLSVLQVPGVVRIVGFDGRPSSIPENEITKIREFLNHGYQAEPYPFLTVGRRARIVRGPLAGMQGTIIRRKNRLRFIISLELIQRSMAVEVDETDLESVV
jgi:transcription antitermination factor NusG